MQYCFNFFYVSRVLHLSFYHCMPIRASKVQVQWKTLARMTVFLFVLKVICSQYAVKAQTSLAPLSRFRGSHVTLRMHTNVVDFRVMRGLCRREWNWQSVNQHSWDPRQRTTWSGLVTSDFNSVCGLLACPIRASVISWSFKMLALI